MIKKVILRAVLALLVLGALLSGGGTAFAAESAGTGFYVRAVLPENQVDTGVTYFDLKMLQGQTQMLEVQVVNETDKEIAIEVKTISASTNRGGVIDYQTPDIRDTTLAHPFSELAKPQTDLLSIPAYSTASAFVSVTMPEEEYDGVVLGGLVFTRNPQTAEGNQEGVSLQNAFSYVIGVKLTETDVLVAPDFELDRVAAETVNYQPAMVHILRNKNAAIAKGISLTAVVRDSNGRTVAEVERQNVDMAPNSVMPWAVTPGAGVEENPPSAELQPGEYSTLVTLEYEGEVWRFEQNFTIQKEEAATVNAESIGSENTEPINGIVVVLLIAAAIIIVILIIIILLILRRAGEKSNRYLQKGGKHSR